MPNPRHLRLGAAVSFVALLAIIVRLAWVSDDAYISLRSVEHWMAGHGPVWNTAERVQTFTHPLWMLLLAGGRWLSGECYFTTLGLGIGCSLLAALVLLRLGRTAAAAIATLAALAFARSFPEYATSGLENPLSFLLLAGFAGVVSSALPPTRRYLYAALLTGLVATTRMDLGLLCAPAAVACARGLPVLRVVLLGIVGLLPFLLWTGFATVYYGSPFPITAYAKAISVGLDAKVLWWQGLHYCRYVLTHDPAMVLVLAAGTTVGLLRGSLRCRWLAVGVLVYSAYIVKVGGDFMGGRFFTPPFVVAVAILARWFATMPHPAWPLACGALLPTAAVLAGFPAWVFPPSHDKPPTDEYHGIIDERLFYYWNQGLLSSTREIPVAGSLTAAQRQAGRQTPMVIPWGMVGRYGFEAGELVHICDSWLLDPLLMRLPIQDRNKWRIGHFIRRIPEGYLETLATGENRLHHPGLRRYYETLRAVIRDPVADRERLAATWRLLSGAMDADLRAFLDEQYYSPPRLDVAAAALAGPVPPGTFWFDDPRIRLVYHGGLRVALDAPETAKQLRLLLQGEMVYTLRLCRGDTPIATLQADTRQTPRFLGVQPFHVDVPEGTPAFDRIDIDAGMNSELVPAIGGLSLQ